MKKLLSLLSGFLLVFAMSVALADDAPVNAMAMSSILQNLQTKGYTVIKKVDYEKGAFEVKAVDAQGKRVEMHVNPQTGDIIDSKEKKMGTTTSQPPADTLSALDAVKKVEQAGYHNVYKVEAESHSFEVVGLDSNNQKTKLEVDMKTGAISKKMS